MTKNQNGKTTQQVMSFVVILAGLAVSTNGQGICVHPLIVVSAISGKVISQLDRGETPVTQASIVLLENRYRGRVLTQTTSDAAGEFKFNKKIRPGRYVLKVSYPNLASFYGPVKLMKFRSGLPTREIIVIMGADFTKPCGGTSAELRPKKDE
jgi:hypothetical protein